MGKEKKVKEKNLEQQENQEELELESASESEQPENELDLLKKQVAELSDKNLRTFAEFDNFRKRNEKEKLARYDDGAADTVVKFLPVADSFERFLKSFKGDENDEFFKGVTLICRQFQDALKSLNVTEIAAVGEKFSTELHNAVAHIEDENFGENEIAEEFQKGYKYKDRVIRHSFVKVAN
ncbi:MAG: nucleotide exchange factor GrpE [Clostridiales bacterium]|jgi:molecular chaperone GrpE|nr:nucleotide exchange factor GrpE [Clostridiales bacterium]